MKKLIFIVAILLLKFTLKAQQPQPFISENIFQTNLFIENKGQFKNYDKDNYPVKYALDNNGDHIYFDTHGFIWALSRRKDIKNKNFEREEREVDKKLPEILDCDIEMQWKNSNPSCTIEAFGKSDHYFTYGAADLNSYGYKRIVYKSIYHNIDIEYTIPDSGGIKYTIILHPGADLDQILFTYNGQGVRVKAIPEGLKIKNEVDYLLERDLKANYDDGTIVHLKYVKTSEGIKIKSNMLLSAGKTLIIDPWVVSITTLTATSKGNNKGFDVDYDYQGNLYVYGGGFTHWQTPENQKVAKYSSTGILLWTFSGSLPSIGWESKGDFGFDGNFAVEKTTGKVFIVHGVTMNGTRLVRLNTNGNYDSLISNGINYFKEGWEMNFDCQSGQVIIYGGDAFSPLNIGKVDSIGNNTVLDFTGASTVSQDVICATTDGSGDKYVILASFASYNVNNHLFKLNRVIDSFVWDAWIGDYPFIEINNKPYSASNNPGYSSNGFNALAANSNYLFCFDGRILRAFNKFNGTALGYTTVVVTDTTLYQGGIYADECNNVYLGGSKSNIKVLSFNGVNFNKLSDLNIGGASLNHTYDMKYNPGNNLIYICGERFVATRSPNVGCSNKQLGLQISLDCSPSAILSISNFDTLSKYSYYWFDSTSNSMARVLLNSNREKDTLSSPIPYHVYNIRVVCNECCGGATSIVRFIPGIINTTTNVKVCEGQSYLVNNHSYTVAGVYKDTLISAGGCDSIITSVISLVSRAHSTRYDTLCFRDTLSVGTHKYWATGIYTDTLQTKSGCDSVVTSNLFVRPPVLKTLNVGLCQGDTFQIASHKYYIPGSYFDTLPDQHGCDSVIHTIFTVNLPVSISTKVFLCPGNSYIVGSHSYSTPGTYTDSLKTIMGCDSVITTLLSQANKSVIFQKISICPGANLTIGKHTYTSGGTYVDTLLNSNGCDSVITTELGVYTPALFSFSTSICAGDSLMIGLHNYANAGSYTDTLKSIAGCDSIIKTILTIADTNSSINTFSLCFGQKLHVGNHYYNTSGTYIDTLSNYSGCDSVVVSNLTVLPSISSKRQISICEGQSFLCGGKYQKIGGNYNDTLISINGCDSILTTQLFVSKNPTANFDFDKGKHIYDSIAFYNMSSNATSWVWHFGDNLNSTSTLKDPTFIYTKGNGMKVTLIAIDDSTGCTDTIYKILNLVEDGNIIIPNVFTPNNDGLNDFFQVDGYGIVGFEIQIFNRWGEIIYNSSDFNFRWSGNDSPTGVYYYKIQFETAKETLKVIKGCVTLIR